VKICARLPALSKEPRKVIGLDALAAQILERDRVVLEGARSYWLLNGLDLLRAKQLIGHGNFEAWCETKLDYSKSKVEKLMRAATLFGPMLESGNLTDLPPRSLAYQLSAPSFPQQLEDEFVPRLIAGEQAALNSARVAVRKHQEVVKTAARRVKLLPEQQELASKREATQARRNAPEEQQCKAERERQAAARSAAVDLIIARLGNDLPKLLALLAAAGPDGTFSYGFERELEVRRAAMATNSDAEA